ISWEPFHKPLVAAILENERIRKGLFPGPGANPSSQKGGGTPKTEHYWALAQIVFGEHP
ncbi:hypothetical protein PUNSTDRAFT_32081, partial [Punctularia strigosozonata HHB-11173 SS5]|uniref:uncharacterized protein n=1 Tax=Punctularia strigosozonata (strain HHB-11173) TaxID=741275 RepID=UPI00044174AA